MKEFQYLKPSQVNEAVQACTTSGRPYLFAGGTDLLVGMKQNLIQPDCLIDLKAIPGLDSFERNDEWRFGALTKVRDVQRSPLVQQHLPVLCQAAGSLGSTQVRNRATIGGNLCNASPAADMATMFLALEARAVIRSASGEREIALDDFFQGPNMTVLGKGDIVTGVRFSRRFENCRGLYVKFSPRKAMDIGMVNLALLIETEKGSRECTSASIALGAVAPTPIRARRAEEVLQGQTVTPALIEESSAAAADEARPISDFRASAGYRKALVKKLLSKGLQTLFENQG